MQEISLFHLHESEIEAVWYRYSNATVLKQPLTETMCIYV